MSAIIRRNAGSSCRLLKAGLVGKPRSGFCLQIPPCVETPLLGAKASFVDLRGLGGKRFAYQPLK